MRTREPGLSDDARVALAAIRQRSELDPGLLAVVDRQRAGIHADLRHRGVDPRSRAYLETVTVASRVLAQELDAAATTPRFADRLSDAEIGGAIVTFLRTLVSPDFGSGGGEDAD